MCKPAWVLLTLILGGSATLAQSTRAEIEQKLQERFLSKPMVLRHYYRALRLHFDTNGNVIGQGDPGLGPGDGRILVRDIAIKPAFRDGKTSLPPEMVFYGILPVAIADVSTRKIRLQPGRLTRIVIAQLDEPVTLERVLEAVRSIFLEENATISDPCARADEEQMWKFAEAHSKPSGTARANKAAQPPIGTAAIGCTMEWHAIKDTGSVTPPALYSRRDPEYTRRAQEARLEGLVVIRFIVDSTGRPSNMVVVKSLGEGLDEAAADTLYEWSFNPATRNGTPIPVAVVLEVQFRLEK